MLGFHALVKVTTDMFAEAEVDRAQVKRVLTDDPVQFVSLAQLLDQGEKTSSS